MQKYINIYQPQVIEYGLSLNEGVILDYIMKANSWAKCEPINGRNYFQVNVNKIITDLPILGITTKSTMLKHIKKLLDLGFLNRKIISNTPYYSPTNKTKEYYFGGVAKLTDRVCANGDTSVAIERYNSNVNSNVNYIYIDIDQVKKKNKSLINNLEDLLSSLYGAETDLNDVEFETIAELWNGYNSKYKLPKVNLENKGTSIYRDTKKAWNLFKSEFNKEDFNKGLKNYFTDIEGRDKNNSYSKHRFTLYQFLKQSNGIRQFMQLN